jgi:hypothetical protein
MDLQVRIQCPEVLKSYIPGGGFVTPSGLTGTSSYQDVKNFTGWNNFSLC